MDLLDFKKQHIRQTLGIPPEDFPRIISFIDFANVNKWFTKDMFDENGVSLPAGKELTVDLQKLAGFLRLFSDDVRFYYGTDPRNPGSGKFTGAARYTFGSGRVFTKDVQRIRHDLTAEEAARATRAVQSDGAGSFIYIPKCNFDVEITLDTIRLTNHYDTFCLLSGDADFAPLLWHLKRQGKKIVLIKGGRIQAALGKTLDVKINAQDIKQYIAVKKQKPGS
ncbi:MAG: NYN domain-containing protein [bacterium]|nr:NYN domain-containing protein [bacterium]